MTYIDNTFYKDVYFGFKVPSESFPYYSSRATERINSAINVIELVGDEITVDIKKCTCAVMDLIHGFDNTKVVASETTGPYKKSFANTESKVLPEKQVYNTMVEYLSKTGLLYRGATNAY